MENLSFSFGHSVDISHDCDLYVQQLQQEEEERMEEDARIGTSILHNLFSLLMPTAFAPTTPLTLYRLGIPQLHRAFIFLIYTNSI